MTLLFASFFKDVKTIRLIYSGKQLNDSLILKEFIRTGSEASIIHLVHSMNITNDQPAPTPNLSNKSEAEQSNFSFNLTFN